MSDPKPKGLFCPHCRGHRLTVISSSRPAPGVKVRYRQCSACGAKLKTREILIVPANPPRSPET